MVAWLGRTLLVAGLLVARPTSAQSAEPAPLRLVVSEGASSLDAHRIRTKLETEVGRPVELADGAASTPPGAVVTIALRPAENELTVGYVSLGGERLARTVVPAPGDDPAEIAVLLAGNLVRDQAGELLPPPLIPPTPEGDRVVATAAAKTNTEPERSERAWPSIDHVEATAWTATLGLANAGLRLSIPLPKKAPVQSRGTSPAPSPEAYALLSACGHLEAGRRLVGGGLALGVAFPWNQFGNQLAVEVDIGTTFLYGLDPGTDGYTNTRLVSRLRTALAYRSSASVTLFLGVAPALSTRLYGDYGSEAVNTLGAELFGGARL